MVSASLKSLVASLKVKVTSAVLAARLTSLLPTVTPTLGVTVSTTKAVLVKPVPGLLPVASCQVPAVTLTEPLLMSVAGLAVKVAV